MGNVASKYMKSLCKRHATAKIFLDCAGRPRELIESLQKKVRKGQVSGTGSPFMPTLHMLFFSTYYGKVMY